MLHREERWRALTLSLMGVVLLSGCAPEPAPNVLLVTFDTTRHDRVGFLGDSQARTPVVDALAERGMVFEHAYASTPLTLPSHTVILSGVPPIVHGVHNNGTFRVPDELETLPEILARSGYETAAFVSAFVLDARYNLNQGFETYSDKTKRRGGALDMTVPQRAGAETTDEALGWLAEHDGESPFFLWVHYYDPHLPRDVQAPFDEIRDEYRAEIAYTDAQLGRLLEGVERSSGRRQTLIAFMADHGESLGQHGEHTHAMLAYDASLHIPMLFAGPGVPGGVRSQALATQVDVVPTILETLGLPIPEALAGRNLLTLPTELDPDDDSVAGYFETHWPADSLGWAPIEGIRTSRWKYTALPTPVELYDIHEDPLEQKNLASEQTEVVEEMAERFAALEEEARRIRLGDARIELEPEDAQQLAALGYVSAAPIDTTERPDPRTFVVVHHWVSAGRSLAMKGEYDRAIESLEVISESPSVRGLALRTLAPIYREAGRHDEAIGAYRDYIELTGADEAYLGLAAVLTQVGRAEEALATLDSMSSQSLSVSSRRTHALYALGRYAEARDLVDEAFASPENRRAGFRLRGSLVLSNGPLDDGEAELRAVLAQAPDDSHLKSDLGLYLALWGEEADAEESIALLRASSEAAPEDSFVLGNAGWGLYRQGEADESKRLLERSLEQDPANEIIRVRLAEVLYELGENEEALELVQLSLKRRPHAAWSKSARLLIEAIEAEPAQEEAASS